MEATESTINLRDRVKNLCYTASPSKLHASQIRICDPNCGSYDTRQMNRKWSSWSSWFRLHTCHCYHCETLSSKLCKGPQFFPPTKFSCPNAKGYNDYAMSLARLKSSVIVYVSLYHDLFSNIFRRKLCSKSLSIGRHCLASNGKGLHGRRAWSFSPLTETVKSETKQLAWRATYTPEGHSDGSSVEKRPPSSPLNRNHLQNNDCWVRLGV